MSIEAPQPTEVVIRYSNGRGQLVVDGKDIAGRIVRADVRCQAGRCWLAFTIDAFGTEVLVEVEAVDLIATVPMSAIARRTLAALAYD